MIQPENGPALLAEAGRKYRQWLQDGARGRLHLTEPEGQNICAAVSGKGLERLRTSWRRLCLVLAVHIPGNAWKIFWLRRAGLTIGRNVFITHGVKFDWLAPWLITLEDGCMLGYEAVVAGHLYYQKKLILRKVVIGRQAVVGLRALALASLGAGSVLGPGSVLLTDAPDGTVWNGVPARPADWI
ncbi:MAG: hypothetical protein LBK52_02405 [Deltaproteobacteria bacterium]|nr:hypothetical protein [Deltaproteobacteria bacterium]